MAELSFKWMIPITVKPTRRILKVKEWLKFLKKNSGWRWADKTFDEIVAEIPDPNTKKIKLQGGIRFSFEPVYDAEGNLTYQTKTKQI